MTPTTRAPGAEALRRKYDDAVAALVARLQEDRTIIAAILFGSLAYDDVWEKSDVDMMIVSTEERRAERHYSLVEDGINFHVGVMPRSGFRAWLERSLQGSWAQSIMARSRLLFSRDSTLAAYYHDVTHLGEQDRALSLLMAATWTLSPLAKAGKWYHVRGDLDYTFVWLIYTLQSLATVEVLLHGQIPGREVIPLALQLNPTFFQQVYPDLIHGPKDRATLGAALSAMERYLVERIPTLFGPVLAYLAQAGGVRAASELNEHLARRAAGDDLSSAYEWLADQGIIQKVSAAVRLTEKSRVDVAEAAYYYDGADPYGAGDAADGGVVDDLLFEQGG
jgi:predicted nucleotidyltransferase